VVQGAQGLEEGGGLGEELNQLQVQSGFKGGWVVGEGIGGQGSEQSVE